MYNSLMIILISLIVIIIVIYFMKSNVAHISEGFNPAPQVSGKKNYAGYGSSPNSKENPEIIKGGSFITGSHVEGLIHDENNNNCHITQMANPGLSNFVLVLSPNKVDHRSHKINTLVKYCIMVDVEPGKYYILSCQGGEGTANFTSERWSRDVADTRESPGLVSGFTPWPACFLGTHSHLSW